jgi:RimJ/RimL family protein N-acetyltransferase
MKPAATLTGKDGKKYDVRMLEDFDDAEAMTDFVNACHDSSPYLSSDKAYTVEEERAWVDSEKKNIAEGKTVYAALFDCKRVVGSASVRCKGGRQSHVAVFGVMLRPGYRDKGLGTALAREAIKRRTPRMQKIALNVYSGNAPARHVYAKLGFRDVAQLKGWFKADDGTVEDEFIMELLK